MQVCECLEEVWGEERGSSIDLSADDPGAPHCDACLREDWGDP